MHPVDFFYQSDKLLLKKTSSITNVMIEIEKPIKFSQHALDNIFDRGTSREKVEQAIRTGERLPAKKGRIAFRKNFSHHGMWKGK